MVEGVQQGPVLVGTFFTAWTVYRDRSLYGNSGTPDTGTPCCVSCIVCYA